VRPEIVAHDLHPLYHSTRYALSRLDVQTIAVQHHHAHVASAMAENGLSGPVLGVAYDGSGWGTDGTSWGGEILLVRAARFERLGTFRPIPLPGGEAAIREPWRIALALLDDAFEGEPPLDSFPLFRKISPGRVLLARELAARGIQSPLARGIGRYFDAFGALFLDRPVSRYEGQVALEWNLAADEAETGPYPFVLSKDSELPTLDLSVSLRAAVEDFLRGADPGGISGRFHHTLARATAALVRSAAGRAGRLPVVLTGGCFQNALLAERVRASLTPEFPVFLHGRVPPGDGGLALGQAVVAAAMARDPEGGR
jgi:hydrogenase maturation protein HypF